MKKLNQDQFAKFIYDIALNKVKNYNFDGFYDIAKIVNDLKQYRSISEKPIVKNYFLFYRHTGMDLISENCDTYKIRYENNLDFSAEKELILNYIQLQEGQNFGLCPFDLALLNIETAGQIKYFVETGNFPSDQRKFAISELIKFFNY